MEPPGIPGRFNTASGQRVGWFDRRKDDLVVEVPALRRDCEQALLAYGVCLPSQPRSDSTEATDATVNNDPGYCQPAPVPDRCDFPQEDDNSRGIQEGDEEDIDCTDLALNKPGQGIRKIAVQCWEAEPFRILQEERSGIFTDERAYRIGADGEEIVGRELARLPVDWKTLHSVPYGSHGSDIDHVLIGPGGVFTINTKHRPEANVWVAGNNFLVNRRHTFYVGNSRFEAERASEALSSVCGCQVAVCGIIAVVGARGGFCVKSQPEDGAVIVLHLDELTDWFTTREASLNSGQIDITYEWARRSTTWQ